MVNISYHPPQHSYITHAAGIKKGGGVGQFSVTCQTQQNITW